MVGTVRKNKTFIPGNMQPHKNRKQYSTEFAFNKEATLCSYVPKKNKAVVMISTMHSSNEVEDSVSAKPEIIQFYNQTKGGVDNMDKMLAEYTVQRKTNRWPLAMFYNMLNIAALAAYVIYHEHNTSFKSTNKRRKFLQDLSLQLCMPAIEARLENPMVMAKYFTRTAIEQVLGRELPAPPETEHVVSNERDTTGRLRHVGVCQICKSSENKRRKTRKRCSECLNPVCNEHSKDVCNDC